MHLDTRMDRYSPEIAALLEELLIRPLPGDGEPTVLREAEEVLLCVVDEVRGVALFKERHLEPVEGRGPPAAPLLVRSESIHRGRI
jgi:hypothetical protein